MKLRLRRKHRAKWSSERAFVLATAAAAVGLGNIWRFPYIAGENGGASFIIAYIIAVIVIGLPLMVVEISAGRIEKGGVVKTFRAVNKHTAWFGWMVVGLTLIILSYYLVVTGWTLGFALDSLNGNLNSFDEFTSGYKPLFYFGLSLAITAAVAYKGIKFIEKTTMVLMPVLLVVILILTGYSITTPGFSQAASFLFAPDFSSFTSTKLWALAFGQAFYSLAIGQGYLMTYGSFLPKRINLPRATAAVAGIETTIALIAGLMIFPIVFTFGLSPGEGTELAFTTLPLAFGSIAIGPILAIVFFWLFFLAAISSCIASMEVIKTSMREELNLSNARAVLIAVGLLLPLGIISAFSFTPLEIQLFGRPFLQFMDMITANQIVVLSGLIGGVIISWSIPHRAVIKLFSRRYRHLAWHTVIATRYLWAFVLMVLTASLFV